MLMKIIFGQPFIIVVCGLMGSHRKAVSLALSAFFGCRYINAGFLMESAVYLLWKEMESKALNLDNQEEVGRIVKELLPRIDYSDEPVKIDGVDTSEIIEGKGHSLRKEIRVTIDNRRREFYVIAGYPRVKQVVESYLYTIVKKTIASGKYAGVVIRTTKPYSWKEAMTLMLTAPLEIMAKNVKRPPEVVRAWNVVTGNENYGPWSFPGIQIYEIPIEKLNHRQAYLMAREAVFMGNKRLAAFICAVIKPISVFFSELKDAKLKDASSSLSGEEGGLGNLLVDKRGFSRRFFCEPPLDKGVIGEMPAMGKFFNGFYMPLFKVNYYGFMFWLGEFNVGGLFHLTQELSAIVGIPESGFFSFSFEFWYLFHILTSLSIIETVFRFSHISGSNNSRHTPAFISDDKEKITSTVASPIGGIFIFPSLIISGSLKQASSTS